MLDKQKDVIQQKALSMWLRQGKAGTCEIITGLGKTFIALHALYTMPQDHKVTHIFLAEVRDRKIDLMKDIDKYNKIFKRDVLADYNLEFHCYQTVHKWKDKEFGLVIADEIHDALTPVYLRFFKNNKYGAIIGLSATITTNTTYTVNGQTHTKEDILNKYAPICFSYTLEQGIEEGTSRDLNIYVIKHNLDNKEETVLAGNKKRRFYQTEKNAYDYWDKAHKTAWFIEDDEVKKRKIRFTAHKRSHILYNLRSKVIETNKLILGLAPTRTILFGNSLDRLLDITPNVVSSRNTDEENAKIRRDLETGAINLIGSFKKLKQGANLPDLENCVIMSYFSTDKDFIQRIGRLRQNGKIGNVFIFLTMETQETVWFGKIFANKSNLNLIYCRNVEEALEKIQ